MKAERLDDGGIRIAGIQDDLDHGTTMTMSVNGSGDVFFTIWGQDGQSLDFAVNNGLGGTHTPGLAGRLREAADYIMRCQEDPEYRMKFMARRLQRPEIP